MEPMLDRLVVAMFAEQVGETFRLHLAEGTVLDLVLVEARTLSTRPGNTGPRRDPFSLLFLGPKAPVLPQRIYPLENEAFGRLEIFLVPIGADAGGVKYEAIFN
jgi:hypothetical protein